IQYRLTDSSNLYDSLYMMKTVINATQDMRAAVRYFRKDAATINSFKIDTSMIFIGGASAGAISALHTGILTEQTELPSYIQNIVNTEGGLEGNSGSPGYSSNVAGIINLCGALNRAEWISSTSVPIVSIHGTQDGTVPFGHGEVLASSVGVFANLITVDGSSPIHNRAQSLNVKNQLWAIEGADHMAHTLPQYQQQAETFVSDFLYTIVCPNSSIDEILDVSSEVNVYPNPTRDILNIDMTKTQFKAGDELYFYDVFGHVALQGRIDSKFVTINTDTANGIYQLVIKGENITAVKNVVVGK
ncbi:MAG: T9SS type A sorting domain-containing protein, partial [Saprospiraceae bacterium]